MSSGFVSGGTTDKPIERDDEWHKAQQDIEANHRRKEEERTQQGGKTLYDVLQSNKAAKQDAFEESIRLKNQFRNLDEDEVEFLDSVLESTRKKEEEVKKQTTEQLEIFRRQQEEADKAAIEGSVDVNERERPNEHEEEEKWAVNKGKRKRVEEKKGLKGLKLRKASSSAQSGDTIDPGEKIHSLLAESPTKQPTTRPPVQADANLPAAASAIAPDEAIKASEAMQKTTQATPSGLGLAGYSSDEDD